MIRFYILLMIFNLVHESLHSQDFFRVMSYNVENFFDTKDNPLKEDDDFLPYGIRGWTPKRYYLKLQRTAKVIFAAGEWSPPSLVGLCEVENDTVLEDLLHLTPLRNLFYQYCITDGDDVRGINLALLYRRDQFRFLSKEEIPVPVDKWQRPTRPILYVSGQILTGDTLDVFVCHFPSRYAGEKQTEQSRLNAARIVRHYADSVRDSRLHPQIIIMGDFNDMPHNPSLADGLQSRPIPELFTQDTIVTDCYYNLFHRARGTHKYQGEWWQLDHMIVNGLLLNPDSPFHLNPGSEHVFVSPFLFKDDRTWGHKRLFRTYYGYQYEGGFSDHLPIVADFIIKKSSVDGK